MMISDDLKTLELLVDSESLLPHLKGLREKAVVESRDAQTDRACAIASGKIRALDNLISSIEGARDNRTELFKKRNQPQIKSSNRF